MKENIVRLLRTTEGRVNIKARTHEKVSTSNSSYSNWRWLTKFSCPVLLQVDSIGESRSYACHVVVLLEKL
jgi:2-C-methyl-D-erythritol 2,4-cyclodiphosphate synthase